MPLSQEVQTILSNLKAKKCALIIGPEIYCEASENSYLNELITFLQAKDCEVSSSDEGFLHFGKAEANALDQIKEFFNAGNSNPVYEMIAQIPFHLIISLSPDLLLEKTFDQLNLPYRSRFYLKRESQDFGDDEMKDFKFDEKTPLIYHLLGSVDDKESLVFTFSDLFDYLQSIFGQYELPKYLMYELKKRVEHFVILGFQYEKWYFKLLFKLLNKREKTSIKAYFDSKKINEDVRRFYESNLSFVFVESKPREFISDLYVASGNLLKKGSFQAKFEDEIDQYLDNNHFSTALFRINEKFSNFNLTNIEADYNRLKNEKIANIKTGEQIMVEENKIRSRIREFLTTSNE